MSLEITQEDRDRYYQPDIGEAPTQKDLQIYYEKQKSDYIGQIIVGVVVFVAFMLFGR